MCISGNGRCAGRDLLAVFLLLVAMAAGGCAGGMDLVKVRDGGITAAVAAGSLEDVYSGALEDTVRNNVQVVQVNDLQGNKIIMNAVMDEESGEMVAMEHLKEIVVQASFRHVAERNGMVDLVFELSVPQQLQNSMWQVRFFPRYMFMGDTLHADHIHITGDKFRKIQEWEYRMYNNYVGKIVPDSVADTLFRKVKMMGRFVERNGIVSENVEEHFRKDMRYRINRRMERSAKRIYNRFVADPYPAGGVRLDTVVFNPSEEEIRYFYVQSIGTRAGLRKVEMVMDGEVYANGKRLCSLKSTEPIIFYISSISTLADNDERYLRKVVSRDLHFDAVYNIGFGKGEWKVDPGLGDNGYELASLKDNIVQILSNEDYVLDSIHITAACSPEGKIGLNRKLSGKRGEAIKNHVMMYMERYRDSLQRSVWELDEHHLGEAADRDSRAGSGSVAVNVTELSEDWEGLFSIMEKDSLLKCDAGILQRCAAEEDLDKREQILKMMDGYDYLQKVVYPRLRRVKFNFKLHRKGMLKDTVYTTVLDSVYMKGVEALRNTDYKQAVSLLRPYDCYNTAVAYVCMDYNKSALDVLERLPRDARRDYMLAVVCARLGNESLAVEYFLNSVEQDPAMRHRGNLDPEISALIKKYGIFNNF